MHPFIKFEQVTKKYNDVLALNNVSFAINKGRCVGLIGVNGAGKTTTLKILSGLINATKGKVLFSGRPIVNDYMAFKEKIGYLSQYPKFYEWMTGNEFLSYISDLYGISPAVKKKRIDEVMEIVNLTGSGKKKISGYSGGMKQRLGIAQAILHQPSFLILDEPVSSLDPEGRYQIINLLQKIKDETTILLSTHILHDADSICDDVIILDNGKKIIETDLKQFKTEHKEPVITVSCLKEANDIVPVLKQYQWIEEVKTDRNKLNLKVSNKGKALELLPKILLDNNYTFDSFQMFEPTLEDIFLKLVSNT